jgi:glycosyltransferase involved in cell wall biosynthesis
MSDRVPVRVCHLTSVHRPFDTRIFHKECRSLVAAGYDVTLVAPGAPESIVHAVNLRGIPKSRHRLERLTRTILEVYRAAHAADARIYHIHDSELLPLGLLLRIQGRRVVFDCHEDLLSSISTREWIPAPLRRPAALGASVLAKGAALVFDGVISATPAIARAFVRSKRSVVIANSPFLSDVAATAGCDYTSRGRRALYLGSISAVRGIREMVEAFASPDLSDATLLVVGTFANEELASQTRSLEGWKRVHELSWVGREQLPEIIDSARIGLVIFAPILPHLEAMPTKLFEYMAAGLPVIASDFPMWREIVEGERCGLLVDPTDPVAIADRIAYLFEHPDEARAMGERGRRAVLERFNWEMEVPKLVQMYESIVNREEMKPAERFAVTNAPPA